MVSHGSGQVQNIEKDTLSLACSLPGFGHGSRASPTIPYFRFLIASLALPTGFLFKARRRCDTDTFLTSQHNPKNSHKMAKGLRASRTKKNNQALSKRVFGPVEAARNERLSAKLLALAQQPKAPREEMEIEKGRQTQHQRMRIFATETDASSIESADKDSGAAAEGTPSLSIPIPQSFTSNSRDHAFLLTPPSTPPLDNNMPATPILDRAGQLAMAQEQLFYHMLGASSDVLGFDEDGDLRLAFNTTSPAPNT